MLLVVFFLIPSHLTFPRLKSANSEFETLSALLLLIRKLTETVLSGYLFCTRFGKSTTHSAASYPSWSCFHWLFFGGWSARSCWWIWPIRSPMDNMVCSACAPPHKMSLSSPPFVQGSTKHRFCADYPNQSCFEWLQRWEGRSLMILSNVI